MNDKISVILSALDVGLEVVALDPIDGIDGEEVDWLVFFDIGTELDDKPEFDADEEGGECGNCFNDDITE